MENESNSDDLPQKSKTQIKNEMLELQEIGVQLTKLRPAHLDQIPLSATLRDAIEQTRQITQRSALKRHLQYIGRLMRESDHASIIAAYHNIQQEQSRSARQTHIIEKWRNDLIQGGIEELHLFIEQFPQCDRQQLRNLIKSAQKEAEENKPPVKSQKLFHFIREVVDQAHAM